MAASVDLAAKRGLADRYERNARLWGPVIWSLVTLPRSPYRVRLQRGDETLHDVGHMAPPLFLAVALKASASDIVLVLGRRQWTILLTLRCSLYRFVSANTVHLQAVDQCSAHNEKPRPFGRPGL